MRTNPLNKNYDGRDLRAVSSGEVGLGGDVISKYEKYKQRSKETNASGHGAKKEVNVSFEHTADEPANVRKTDNVSAAAADLGDGWVTHLDGKSGCEYYENTSTGETSWEKPPNGMLMQNKTQG